VRELPFSKYPNIKGLLVSSFRKQLDYLARYYSFVTVNDMKSVIYGNAPDFPKNAVLLTFDDAYVDHFVSVFPILVERGIQGCFFPVANSIIHNEILDVNQIHYILASSNDDVRIVEDVHNLLNQYRNEYGLENNEYYFNKLKKENQYYDSERIAYLKALLQYELPKVVRRLILTDLFKRYVTPNMEEFARELYLNRDQLRCMNRNGMYIGNHGFSHSWMNKLTPEEQKTDIDNSLNFLEMLGVPITDWMMSFPQGAYDESLLNILREQGCSLAVTIEPGIAELSFENSLTLQRLDTNEFPKESKAPPCTWTQKTIEACG